MAIYEITENSITSISETSFRKEGFKEKSDLQRLLKSNINIIAPDTLIISEEFGEWKDSRRRIDLLGIDKEANIVVFELKVTSSGGHMELQALRYAAMVSEMTYEKANGVYHDYLEKNKLDINSNTTILDFLRWDEVDEELFGKDVKIILVSEDFSKEISTTVMWLNNRDLDIKCIRLKPYNDKGRLFIDVQQVIPLPEAEEYLIKIREKDYKERQDREDRGSRQYFRQEFWTQLLHRIKDKTKLFSNISPSKDSWIQAASGKGGIHYIFNIRRYDASVNLVFEGDKSQNKSNYDIFIKHKEEIEKTFGKKLQWSRCEDLVKSYIKYDVSIGGYRSDTEIWPTIQDEMIDKMILLEQTLSPYIAKLTNND